MSQTSGTTAGPAAPGAAGEPADARGTPVSPAAGAAPPATASGVPDAATGDGTPGAADGQVGFRSRGQARRRARFLRRARELAYRDLGGLVFNLHRFGQRNDALVLAKLNTLGQIDTELRALEDALAERRPVTVLREAGITACSRCAAIHSSEDRFCPNCGMPTSRQAELPIAGAVPAAPVPPATATVGAPPSAPAGVQPAPASSEPPPAQAAPPSAPVDVQPAPASSEPPPAQAAPPSEPAGGQPQRAERAAPQTGRSPTPPGVAPTPARPAPAADQPTEILRPQGPS